MLEEALRASPDTPLRGRPGSVCLGHRLERAVRQNGWSSAMVSQVTQEIARFTQRSLAQTKDFLERSRTELNRAAEAFGMRFDEMGSETARQQQEPDSGPRRPAPILQLKILRELSAVLEQKPDVQTVLDMIMEGIYRGIAMDRTVLLVLSTDRRELRLKYALGVRNDTLEESLRFRLAEPDCALLRETLADGQGRWYGPGGEDAVPQALAERLAQDFFLGALRVRGKGIGLIYADCRQGGRALDRDSFEAFRHFLQQGNLALGQLMA
ncbi:hypothetical protein [Alkalilimnicola sp. S0819]|uniref:hypothetical protein n=1 Tax=Alkalilimnicola sp. S0819 TaxID=2613922 RepID=UPI00126207EB|nr:hypothetical protein [Alkalilimnicola sp. S0819]KAB7627503.1 hypothetical protein F3N43_03305 [Alkalilimnicola sp. S0819]MPQ15657.1 hypothetical protein [Alkalilimnicola sp. S0819]